MTFAQAINVLSPTVQPVVTACARAVHRIIEAVRECETGNVIVLIGQVWH